MGPPVTDHQIWQVSANQNPTDGGTMMSVVGHPPSRVTPRASSIATTRPVVHSLIHVAFAGLSEALLSNVTSRWPPCHARSARTLHHGPSACSGSWTHNPPTQSLQDRDKYATHHMLCSNPPQNFTTLMATSYLAGRGIGHAPNGRNHGEGSCRLIGGLLPARGVIGV